MLLQCAQSNTAKLQNNLTFMSLFASVVSSSSFLHVIYYKKLNFSSLHLLPICIRRIIRTQYRFYFSPSFSPSVSFSQEQLEALPELITRCLSQHQERVDQRRNFLHPDTAAVTTALLPTPTIPPPSIGSPLLIPHSR